MRYSIFLFFILSLNSCFAPPTKTTENQPNKKNSTRSEDAVAVTASQQVLYFNEQVKPLLDKSCNHCHANKITDFNQAQKYVVFKDLRNSPLYQRTIGRSGHPQIFSKLDVELDVISNWILGTLNPVKIPGKTVVSPDKLDKNFYDHFLQVPLKKACGSCHANPATSFEDTVKISKNLHILTRGTWSADSAPYANLNKWLGGATFTLPNPEVTTEDKPSPFNEEYFNKHLLADFKESCASCHQNKIDFKYISGLAKFNDVANSRIFAYVKQYMGVDAEILPTLTNWIEGKNEVPAKSPLDRDFFKEYIKPKTEGYCTGCHNNPIINFNVISDFVTIKDPENSKFYQIITGKYVTSNNVTHPAIWQGEYREERIRIRRWINLENPFAPLPEPPAIVLPPIGTPVEPVEPSPLDKKFFDTYLQAKFDGHCVGCHDNHIKTYNQAVKKTGMITVKDLAASKIYQMAIGEGVLANGEKHPARWAGEYREERIRLAQWINLEDTSAILPEPPSPSITNPVITPPEVIVSPLDRKYFEEYLLVKLNGYCTGCHHGNPIPSFKQAVNTPEMIVVKDLAASKIYQMAIGEGFIAPNVKHQPIWAGEFREERIRLAQWINLEPTDSLLPEPPSPTLPGLGNVDLPVIASPLDKKFFDSYLQKKLAGFCSGCHSSPINHYNDAADPSKKLVVVKDLQNSKAYQMAIGEGILADGTKHPNIWAGDFREERVRFAQWINLEDTNSQLPTPPAPNLPTTGNNPVEPDPISQLDKVVFNNYLLERFEKSCVGCHRNYVDSYRTAVLGNGQIEFFVPGNATDSLAYRKASGMDGHPVIWGPYSVEITKLKRWIEIKDTWGRYGFMASDTLFDSEVAPLFAKNCLACHKNYANTLNDAMRYIELRNPSRSMLYKYVIGLENHPKIWNERSYEAELLYSWIKLLETMPHEAYPNPISTFSCPSFDHNPNCRP